LVQRRGRAQGLGGLVLIALGDAVSGGIAGIAVTPTGLRFLPACLLALRLAARALTVTYSVVGPEPAPTDPARFLAGIGHARSSSPARVVNF
jgi:hypothetical protein